METPGVAHASVVVSEMLDDLNKLGHAYSVQVSHFILQQSNTESLL